VRVWGYIIFTLLSVSLGLGLGFWWFGPADKKVEVSSQGVLERVREVLKIATVEGQFSEIYDYKDFYYYDWFPLRKKALIKVSATVSMGYDLKVVKISTNSESKKVFIEGIPDPVILSKDIQHEYYDMQEGSFNAFQPDDLNKMQSDIRRIITSRVERSVLPQMAEERLVNLLGGLQQIISPYGWTVHWEAKKQPTETAGEQELFPSEN